MREAEKRLEYTTPADRYFDYCLWEYEPVGATEEKLRSVNLLYHSFEIGGLREPAYDLIRVIREGFGTGRTVWGVKLMGEKIAWELYFYDYKRRNRDRSATRLLEIIRPHLPCDLEVNENLHYFMFSVDVDGKLLSGAESLDGIHLYIGNPGSTVSSGICYSLKRDATRLENFYFFFDAKREKKEIASKISCSAQIDSKEIGLDEILWPELRDCRVIVVANKQGNDAVYFSRIDVDQLLFFLKRMSYPAELVSFVEEKRGKLDHLLYDVGIDYRMEGKELKILKSGYYGFF